MPNSQLQRFEDTKVQFIDGDRGVNYPSKSELSKNGDCLFLNTGNVTSTGFVFDSIDFISFEKDQKLRKGKAAHEDIIMTTRGTVGNVAFFDPTLPFEHIRINSGMVIVRTDKNEYLPYFLYLFFRSELFRKQCLTNGSGSAQPQLPISALKNISIPKLGTKTQQTIIDVIQKLDKKVELNNKINAELEAMAKLIYDYWFVQFDFPDANGKPYKSSGGKMVYNEELKREIPEGWEVQPLSSILKSNYSSIGKNDNYETIEYLDTGSLTKNAIEGTERISIAIDKVPSRAKRVVHKNDILYSTVRPNLCHYGIIKEPLENMIASTGFAQLSSKTERISNDFIYTFLTSKWVTVRLHQIAALAVSAYPSISPTDILNLNIALPNGNSLMDSANKQFDEIYSKISLNHKENKKLIELRDWLLPMLMNGQVTVKGA